jgi:hypothetical protein
MDQAGIGDLSGTTCRSEDPGSARGFASCMDGSPLFE